MQSYLESSEEFEEQDDTIKKVTFLSYYISLYISTIEHNKRYQCISVDEIYGFVQDITTELDVVVPSITKRDVSYCFSVLDEIGVCTCLK